MKITCDGCWGTGLDTVDNGTCLYCNGNKIRNISFFEYLRLQRLRKKHDERPLEKV